jgi:hypothetical protein
MVAAEVDIDASAVICLGYPLKVHHFSFLPVFYLVGKLSKKCCFHSISNMLNKLISNMLVSCLFTFVYCDDRGEMFFIYLLLLLEPFCFQLSATSSLLLQM